jgi:ATP synthase protein I
MNKRQTLQDNVDAKQSRKLDARRHGERSAWFGLGMFGLVGWSIAIPTLLGIALGIWIDERWPSRFSWTLMLLIGGVGIGCLNAWWWVNRENEDE